MKVVHLNASDKGGASIVAQRLNEALNAYTDGPVNGKQMGKFYELEGSSPAMALSPGDTQTHIQKTIHLKGNEIDLNALTLKLFGVKLSEIKL